MMNAHEGLNRLAGEDAALQGMGATLTLAWLSPGHLTLGHIGDSRLYLHRPAETVQLSKDHTSAWTQWKKGLLSELQFRQHPRRSALYDVLGAGHPSMSPQLCVHALQDGDRLLLCTDGIIDGLWERGIRDELSRRAPARQVAPEILNRARGNSTDDDATLIVADLHQL
jgi:protein phosphatase